MIRYLEKAHPDLKSHAVFPKDDGLAFAAAWVELLADQWLTIQGALEGGRAWESVMWESELNNKLTDDP